jgi:hypothetical protein
MSAQQKSSFLTRDAAICKSRSRAVKDRLIPFAISMVILSGLLSVCGCSEGRAGLGTDGSDSTGGRGTPPPNPIGSRINPLQTFIRTHWTNGDPTSTGGYHRDHIKVYGHCYTNLANLSDGDLQAQFIAENYDMYMFGGTIVGDQMKLRDLLWLYESTNIPQISAPHDSSMLASWLNDRTRNTAGYTFDDLVMHYKWDVNTWMGFTPGWNPADDTNGDLCRDKPASDPSRTAQCISDAEVRVPDYWTPGLLRWRSKVMHPGYIHAVADLTVDWWRQNGSSGFHFDCASYENWSLELGKTFTYEGEDEADPNFPLRTDVPLFVPTVVREMERDIGVQNVYAANTVSPYYSCAIPESKELSLKYLENTTNECWIVTNEPSDEPMSTRRITDYLDCPFVDWLEQGKGYVFSCFDPAGSDRGKRFSLATFYLINHQMAFYAYRTDDHRVREGEHVWNKQWNPYVDFDVGQPTTNSFDLPDFQGNHGTDRYFVYASDARYEILGREYLREDGQRTLILVKIMARGLGEGLDPTIHPLQGTYRPVQPDLTLGDPISQVQLSNNDGVILVEYTE